PVHKPKGVVFGETIVYDGERCIMCTRCIRVCDELAQDPVLDMRQRGNRNEIVLSPGRELDHDYSLMTEHVCPVGALTSSHFRFKARVWFLRTGRTICQGCATGCNAYLDYDPRDNKPYRYRPRDNEEVNGYWMCDSGMLSYPEAHENRLLTARVGGDDASLTEALGAAKRQFEGHGAEPGRVGVVLSARHSLEDNFALAWIAKRFLNVEQVFISARADGRGDDILQSADHNSNRAGVAHATGLVGLDAARPLAELPEAIEKGGLQFVIALGADADGIDAGVLKAALGKLKGYISIASHESPLSAVAHIALPASSWAEARGTYINRKGMHQRADAVLEPYGDAFPGWQLAIALARALGYDVTWKNRGDLEQAMLEASAPAKQDEGDVSDAPTDGAPS
ncbi:MAG: molybdopterin-dependent oxidoreductase, partial [Myxococcota bacterium]